MSGWRRRLDRGPRSTNNLQSQSLQDPGSLQSREGCNDITQTHQCHQVLIINIITFHPETISFGSLRLHQHMTLTDNTYKRRGLGRREIIILFSYPLLSIIFIALITLCCITCTWVPNRLNSWFLFPIPIQCFTASHCGSKRLDFWTQLNLINQIQSDLAEIIGILTGPETPNWVKFVPNLKWYYWGAWLHLTFWLQGKLHMWLMVTCHSILSHQFHTFHQQKNSRYTST